MTHQGKHLIIKNNAWNIHRLLKFILFLPQTCIVLVPLFNDKASTEQLCIKYLCSTFLDNKCLLRPSKLYNFRYHIVSKSMITNISNKTKISRTNIADTNGFVLTIIYRLRLHLFSFCQKIKISRITTVSLVILWIGPGSYNSLSNCILVNK